MQPDLLLLDEITSALDPELVAEVLAMVRELAANGMTMLIATHEMGFARDVASRVGFLDAGRILEIAPPAEIFAAPREERTRRFLQRVIEAGRL
jgi:polar amino acid transport system ATP-binding protein